MGGINFGWVAVWVLSPGWLSCKMEVSNVCHALRWSHRWGKGVWAMPRLCIIYLGICLTTEEKPRKNLSQGNWRAFGWSAPNAIRLVDLAITGDGLDWPAGPCRPWLSHQATESTLGQRKYLLSCRQLASCQKTCTTYTIAGCMVKNSWCWAEELSETGRVLFQKWIWEISSSSWFYYNNLSRCMVTWTSNSYFNCLNFG
jgi:hypothetical protein